MAKNDDWMKKAGVTPGKLTLIGVLAAVLCFVLYRQLSPLMKSKAEPQADFVAERHPNLVAAPATTATDPPAAEAAIPRKKTGTVTSWQSPNLTSIVQYDPFALPASFPQPQKPDEQAAIAQNAAQVEDDAATKEAIEAERAKFEGELEALRQQGVALIIKRNDAYVAVVGDQELHVGDEINGFKVIAIDTKDGVKVAKDLTP